MERLTWKRDLDGYTDVGLQNGVSVGDAICQLADYEDTMTIERAKELAQAEKDGRLVVLPPNAPLTLDELREMDGEPVWISPVRDKRKIPECWMLMSGFLREDRVFLFKPPGGMVQGYPASTYGKTWLAYLRKPEKKAPREGGTA